MIDNEVSYKDLKFVVLTVGPAYTEKKRLVKNFIMFDFFSQLCLTIYM